MATHGFLGEFDSAKETWQAYTERLQQYFVANDIDDADKKRAILLSVCGPATYQLIRNLVVPDKTTDKSLDEIITQVNDHFQPAPSMTVHRFAFNSRSRKSGESVADFVAHLRQLSEHCDFGETLNDMLRDRLVCGIDNDQYQRRLLSEANLTFERAFALAQSMETADQSVRVLKMSKPVEGQVLYV